MKLLMHQCCAPCSIYPLQRLRGEGVNVHGLFYGPNIHPYTEYKRRLDTLIEFNEAEKLEYTIIDEYGLRQFITMAMNTDDRCAGCHRMRLEYAAQYAKNNGFDAFTSTLLYSRRQKHEMIVAIAQEAAAKHGVAFYYEDYRKGWQIGIDVSKQRGMYRQQYCGCIFSEEERYSVIHA